MHEHARSAPSNAMTAEQLGLDGVPPPAPRNPAKFTAAILARIAAALAALPDGALVLDPFAGTGLIHRLPHRTVGVDIEPEYAATSMIQANALALPFPAETFDAIATSPTYGNRLADHHDARDGSTRHSYKHDLGHDLHSDNSGALQWGPKYRSFHRQAWAEARRVLRPGGLFVLNIKDHVRQRRVVRVTDWHLDALELLGFERLSVEHVRAPGLRYGENAGARVDHETVAALKRAR
jgi:tRNA G10  N-methylase Trm11